MPREGRQFDSYLSQARSVEDLAGMADTWAGSPSAKLRDQIAAIRAGLADVARVQAVVASLSARERATLALLHWLGGTADSDALDIAVTMAGFAGEPKTPQSISPAIVDLLRRGLLLHDSLYSAFAWSSSYGSQPVFADARLLDAIGPMMLVPLSISPAPAPSPMTMRYGAGVVLDILAVLHVITRQGRLTLTQQGTVRAADQRRLARALGWNDAPPFWDALGLLIHMLRGAGLLTGPGEALVVSPEVGSLIRQPTAALIRRLLPPLMEITDWQEWPQPSWLGQDQQHMRCGRLAVVVALMALPPGDDFVTLAEFSQVLFARIGDRFSLSGRVTRPTLRRSVYSNPPPTPAAWREQLQAAWERHEQPWIGRVLATWLVYLGLVELEMNDGMPAAFRLTPLGRAVFQPSQDDDAPQPATSPAWVVQPNFEIVIYLERARGEQLALLEHYAERAHLDTHIARYRLTHESVYAGLERDQDTTIADLLDALRRGVGAELPTNVVTTLQDWGRRRDQVTVYRQARIVEFRDAKARQKALDGGLKGTAVGERFVLVSGSAPDWRGKPRFDYTKPRPACLNVTENGAITLAGPPDLFLASQLGPWSEPGVDGTWQLTAASVGAAIVAGRSRDDLVTFLRERLTHPLPLLLEVALRAWSGEPPAGTLETVLVLRCPQAAVARAIAESALFRPAIRAMLGPTTLLVDAEQVEALRESLAWLGMDTVEILQPADSDKSAMLGKGA